jgi:hypothetical protein
MLGENNALGWNPPCLLSAYSRKNIDNGLVSTLFMEIAQLMNVRMLLEWVTDVVFPKLPPGVAGAMMPRGEPMA